MKTCADQATAADTFAIASPGEGIGGGCYLFGTLIRFRRGFETIFAPLPYIFQMNDLCRPATMSSRIGRALRLVRVFLYEPGGPAGRNEDVFINGVPNFVWRSHASPLSKPE
jgi:hypothetical protein